MSRTKQVAETAVYDNRKLADEKEELGKENRIMKKEIDLLEDEHSKALNRQKGMKSRLTKMDKIVYGGAKKEGKKKKK